MLTIAVVLFAIAALGGLALAGLHFTGRTLPWPLSIVHGLIAAAGLLSLIAAALSAGDATGGHWAIPWAIGIFVVAALGGFFMAYTHLKEGTRPSSVVVIHGAAAVVAFGLLLLAVFG